MYIPDKLVFSKFVISIFYMSRVSEVTDESLAKMVRIISTAQ